jgi:RNA polymerase sigma factor for flagellar operon FliA
MNAEGLFLQHLDRIDKMAESACMRNGLGAQEAEEFAAEVRLKLCEDDYAVLRKFRGGSSLTTYLSVVIGNLFRDYRISRWGKWRPSAQARRLGEVAMQLESLVYRDGHTFDSACQVLAQRRGAEVRLAELRRLYAQLRPRMPRLRQGEDDPDTLLASDQADAPVLDAERDARLAAAEEALRRALARLPDEDRLIIRLLYYEGMTVADVARGLRVEQKPLYPRIRHLHRLIAEALRKEGITVDVLDFLNA